MISRDRCLLLLLLLVAAPGLPGAEPATDPPFLPEIRVEVLEEAWRVGDEKTYTLLFDRAPFGRHALQLVSLETRPDGAREATFRQRLHLDLRAIGQQGTLEQSGTILYAGSGAGTYRYDEARLLEGEYDTYRSPRDYDGEVTAELDPVTGGFRVAPQPGSPHEGPLPRHTDAIVLDLLALGHWERVFSMRPRWPLSSTSTVPLLIPTAAPRFDFHRPVDGPRQVRPELVPVEITVEAIEKIDLFEAKVEAFRCRIEPMGYTLWVSPNGGILRFEDGRGLTGMLEP